MTAAVSTSIHQTEEYVRFCQGKLADPYPLYHRLRFEDPVHWSDLTKSWILTRYVDVVAVLQHDPRLTAERLTPLINQLPQPVKAEIAPLRNHLATWMQYYDPPDHTRLRSLVGKAFTPGILERLRPRIQEIVDGLLDEADAKGRMDVIRDFAYPLPAIVIAELLGVPAEDRDQFKRSADAIAAFLEGVGQNFPEIARRAQKSVLELTDYLRGLIEQRRVQPRDDLMSALVAVEEAGDKLTEAEMFGMCVFLLHAGHETTTGLIGNGLLALLRNPDELRKLKENPTLITSAVEEFLRYDSSVQRISRVAKQELEIGGKLIKPGERLWAMQGAANRDPAQFPDPDRLDICREKNRHVAFGYGIHFCLGAPLARLEAPIAFNTLLRRFPSLHLPSESLEWQQGVSLRTLKAMPVELRF